MVEDAVQVTGALKARYPGLPVLLFGHSMGSMVVRCYIQEHDGDIDSLVVLQLRPAKIPWRGAGVALAKVHLRR